MGSREVLVYFEAVSGSVERKAVRVAAKQGDTVADLKRRVAAAEGHPPGSTQQVVFTGQRLDDQDVLDKCGLSVADGSEEWADQRIYPNCWFLLSHRKALAKVRDPTWPVIRELLLMAQRGGIYLLAAGVLTANLFAK
ncbi:hypothetical protein WJX72_011862 [[Myrmecia] bisecta]|uniref:Ubiquitin-like domain-containing protein n=1 Tax=[Myrmecia] bisecta TaxID=41462 RepID=A0AAW1Q8S2_9CHLO